MFLIIIVTDKPVNGKHQDFSSRSPAIHLFSRHTFSPVFPVNELRAATWDMLVYRRKYQQTRVTKHQSLGNLYDLAG